MASIGIISNSIFLDDNQGKFLLENNSLGSLSLIILIKNSLDLGPAIAKAPN